MHSSISPRSVGEAAEEEPAAPLAEQQHDESSEEDSEDEERDDDLSEEDDEDDEQQEANGNIVAEAVESVNGNGKVTPSLELPKEGSADREDDQDEEEEEEGDENEDDDDNEDDNEDDDEDEEEEEEPAFKYGRLGTSSTEILTKDSASALASSNRFLALGTHNGMVHILSYEGTKMNSYRPHGASIMDIQIDEEGEFVATAAMDGRVFIHSLLSSDHYAFDLKRPMRSIAMEPSFSKKSGKRFVCGGMSGQLLLHEKGWLGHKEQVLHEGEGPIWSIKWRGNLIAWANDLGVKVYDTIHQQRIAFIDRPPSAPRADMFKPTIFWQDDENLLVAWADYVKIVRIAPRTKHGLPAPSVSNSNGSSSPSSHIVEIKGILQLDCMISGISPYKGDFLVLAFVAPDTFSNEATDNPIEQRRKAANRPELRMISRAGEELSSDALSLTGFELNGCNDYVLVGSQKKSSSSSELDTDEMYIVVSPKDIVVARPRDAADHVDWLVEIEKYEEALSEAEKLQKTGKYHFDITEIGSKFIRHLIGEGHFDQAAALCPKVLGGNRKAWEDWVFLFAQKNQLGAITPFVPTSNPLLSDLVYEMIIGHFLSNDPPTLLKILKEWPAEIYNLTSVINAVEAALATKSTPVLIECLAELHIVNRQPGKALPYLIRLRRPNVFELIKDYNLFTDVQDQALLLVEFDQELLAKGEEVSPLSGTAKHGKAVALLVDHTHSIPINRVVAQLQSKPKFLYMYLDSLFEKDAHLTVDYADNHVALCAEFDYPRLMDLLRSSTYYNLEKVYGICRKRDYVPEMVFLLGRMGNNKEALMLIIERLGDVERAIEFAKEQNDGDLWEDLLRYSENKPDFIKGLLENVGTEIDPVLLIRRIKNGLEIPGLKEALIKILQGLALQTSLLEGTQSILKSDCNALAHQLTRGQNHGVLGSSLSVCAVCGDTLFKTTSHPMPTQSSLVIAFGCGRHVSHASCSLGNLNEELPLPVEDPYTRLLLTERDKDSVTRKTIKVGSKIRYLATLRLHIQSCPSCLKDSSLAGDRIRIAS